MKSERDALSIPLNPFVITNLTVLVIARAKARGDPLTLNKRTAYPVRVLQDTMDGFFPDSVILLAMTMLIK